MYATKQNMIDRFGNDELVELTDRGVAGVIDDTVLSKSLDDASATMDGYIDSRYTLPLASVPVSLERVCCDIARYYLYDEGADEAVSDRHKEAIGFMKDVSRGNVSLGPASDGSAAATNDVAQMDSGGRTFGRNDNSYI